MFDLRVLAVCCASSTAVFGIFWWIAHVLRNDYRLLVRASDTPRSPYDAGARASRRFRMWGFLRTCCVVLCVTSLSGFAACGLSLLLHPAIPVLIVVSSFLGSLFFMATRPRDFPLRRN